MVPIFFPPPRPQSFKPIDGQRFNRVAQYFDANKDGQLDLKEMDRAGSLLTNLGDVFGNDEISNMGRAFNRLGTEIKQGNRNVDINGDGQLDIYIGGRMNEIDQIIGRNNSKLLEEADLTVPPPPPKTDFKPVDKWLTDALFKLFDGNDDRQLSGSEMKKAIDVLGRLGKLLGGNNDMISNLANMFTRLKEEVDAKNTLVDANGDGSISYGIPTFPPGAVGLIAPSELETMTNRNDPTKLEVADTQKKGIIIKPFPYDITDVEKKQIDSWIIAKDLNDYGDPKDTAYLGGTPLFNEATGETTDRYVYIKKNHPDNPWLPQATTNSATSATATAV